MDIKPTLNVQTDIWEKMNNPTIRLTVYVLLFILILECKQTSWDLHSFCFIFRYSIFHWRMSEWTNNMHSPAYWRINELKCPLINTDCGHGYLLVTLHGNSWCLVVHASWLTWLMITVWDINERKEGIIFSQTYSLNCIEVNTQQEPAC